MAMIPQLQGRTRSKIFVLLIFVFILILQECRHSAKVSELRQRSIDQIEEYMESIDLRDSIITDSRKRYQRLDSLYWNMRSELRVDTVSITRHYEKEIDLARLMSTSEQYQFLAKRYAGGTPEVDGD